MKELVWSKTALRDLDSIYEFISADSSIYAKRTVQRIINRCKQAIAFPDSGRRVPESTYRNRRELIEGNYRIIYDIEDDQIFVLTVVHGAQNWNETS